jgi:hypothetical protein
MRSLSLQVALASAGLVVLSCDNPNPGTPIGTFAVASALTGNSCGSEVAETSPGSFDVTISNDDGVVYWFPSTGGTAVSGSINAARTVSISEAVADDVDETDSGSGACILQRNDTLSFTLASGAAPSSFTGSYSFTFSPATGSSCSDQLAARGGTFGQLPCTVSYALTGARN